jgi:hypothetical protein
MELHPNARPFVEHQTGKVAALDDAIDKSGGFQARTQQPGTIKMTPRPVNTGRGAAGQVAAYERVG